MKYLVNIICLFIPKNFISLTKITIYLWSQSKHRKFLKIIYFRDFEGLLCPLKNKYFRNDVNIYVK